MRPRTANVLLSAVLSAVLALSVLSSCTPRSTAAEEDGCPKLLDAATKMSKAKKDRTYFGADIELVQANDIRVTNHVEFFSIHAWLTRSSQLDNMEATSSSWTLQSGNGFYMASAKESERPSTWEYSAEIDPNDVQPPNLWPLAQVVALCNAKQANEDRDGFVHFKFPLKSMPTVSAVRFRATTDKTVGRKYVDDFRSIRICESETPPGVLEKRLGGPATDAATTDKVEWTPRCEDMRPPWFEEKPNDLTLN
jgi:hypothetical protein